VPPPLSSSAENAPPRSILLLEEYDALAAAITSALRSFAPGHAILAARSLAEAEDPAEAEPELFILGTDPPWPGLTNFLEKMRDTRPGSCRAGVTRPVA
jgi:hypothetical protein